MNNNNRSVRSSRLANYANLITIKRPPLIRQAFPAYKPVEICLLNACSVKNKSFVIKDFVLDKNIDVLAVTETWLQADISNQLTVNDICPTGFAFHHLPRKHSRGGGVALLYKSRFKLKKLSPNISFKSFEFTDCTLNYASTSLRMVVVYRPPPSKKNQLSVTLFLDEFSSLLEKLIISIGPLVITGDFNFQLDSPSDRAAARFREVLDIFDLKQHVKDSTHKNGHILDLVITRAGDEPVRNVRVSDPAISDHCAVRWEAPCLKKPGFERKSVCSRKLRSIDKDQFVQDIKDSSLMNHQDFRDVSALSGCFDNTLRSLLDHYAPIKKYTVTVRPAAPWYSDNIKQEKAKRRKLERCWRSTKLTIDRELYMKQSKSVNQLIHESKMKFYTNVIEENTNNQRVLFSCFAKMLNTSAAKKLPTHECPRNLANMFADYFDSKVQSIRASFPTTTADPMNAEQLYYGPELCEFSPTTPTELSSLVKSMAKKSCSLDPIPGPLMTDCFSVLLPVFVNMINLSFKDGLVPALLKEAVLDPVIKKDSLDHELYQNYRPISNLRFVSKATERVVASRLTDHLAPVVQKVDNVIHRINHYPLDIAIGFAITYPVDSDNNLLEIFQSAYKKGHSTETALTQINNDLLRAIDDNACVILVLLDLSAAFDTVYHQILLTRLKCRYGVKGNALAWMRSYLSNRFQYVRVANDCSSKHKLACGVPQGSVLGPILYSMYTAPIADVIKRHGMVFHFYADDTQLYMSFKPVDVLQSKSLIERCIQDVQQWMVVNKLKLNGDKSELLVLTARHRPSPPLDSILIGADIIEASKSAKNIGVWLDNVLSMDVQINNICKTAFFHLRRHS